MKKLFLLAIATTLLLAGQAQNNVGINTTSPNASAALDITSTTQGMLVPRMTQVQRNAISSPATGLLVYQTDNTPGFYYYSGTAWASVAGGGGTSLPSQTGNAGKTLNTDGSSASWTQVTPFMSKTTSAQLVNTTSPSYKTIVGIALEAGKSYFINTQIFSYKTGATNAPLTTRLRYTGDASTDLGILYGGSLVNGTSFNNTGTHDTEAAGFSTSSTATNNSRYNTSFYMTTTTAGTLYVEQARATTNTSNDFNVTAGSYIMATPLQ